MACSVITVFGAEVPLGSAPISWMTGLARQPDAAVQPWTRPPPGPGPLALAIRPVVEDETRDARETGTRAQDVRVRVDLGRRDPERPQQLRRGDVDRSVPVATPLGPVQICAFGVSRAMSCAPSPLAIALGAARPAAAGVASLRRWCGPVTCVDRSACMHDRSRRWRRVGVEGELVRGEVRARVVEDVPVAGRRGQHHDHRDEHADADRRERRARARPVPGQIAQREPGGDRRTAAEARRQRQEERREQDQPGDEEDDPEEELRRTAAPVAVVRATGVAEQQEGEDEEDDARERGTVDLTRRRRSARQRLDDRHLGDRPRRTGRREVGRDDREHHGGDHDGPREREHADDVVRALLETRTVGEPDDEPEDEAEDRTDDTDDRAVGADDETDVAVGRAGRLEHPDRAQAPLREHREAADRDERDEQHAEDQCGERDRLGVERVRLGDRGRGLAPDGP